jgi:uncharacterized protein (TIGR02466 family)
MKLVELFATPVTICELGRDFSIEELFCVDDALKDTYANKGNQTSLNTFVFADERMSELHSFCIDTIDKFSKEILWQQNCELAVTQSWINLSREGDFHHMHNHPNSILSGVLYIEAHEGDIIQFYRTRETNSFLQQTETFNQYNSTSWFIPVKTGDLVIFPSHLFHDVPRVNSKKRISLSFNTFPSGSFGDAKMLTFVG